MIQATPARSTFALQWYLVILFNDLNCEKNILNIPHFYHILSILDKLLSCELHYNGGSLLPHTSPLMKIAAILFYAILHSSYFKKLFNKKDFNSKTNAPEIFHSSSKQSRSLCRHWIQTLHTTPEPKTFLPIMNKDFWATLLWLFENTTLFITYDDLSIDFRAKHEILQKTRLWQGESNSPCACFLCLSEEWECKKTTAIFN